MLRNNFSQSGNVSNVIFSLGALVGGAWLIGEILQAFAKEEICYSCPGCNADITYGETPCNHCRAQLKWPEENATSSISQC
ncbi:MAG: hypothetical protein WCF67_09800 [Chitinophagaceae bacterium]